jgi:quercetin dioxygenase-like cupin family protein
VSGQDDDASADAGGGRVEHHIGELAEVLDNLGVFAMLPTDVIAPCPSGFRRVPIHESDKSYLSLQGFGPDQIAYAHTHPDSEEWVVVLRGTGEARLSRQPVEMSTGMVIGRAAANPHGFTSDGDLHLLSIQLPRPAEASTTWDEKGETTDPIDCAVGGTCRRCARCGGHSANLRSRVFLCENCSLEF